MIISPVAIVMGSRSDWPTLEHAAKVLDELKVAYYVQVVSAHRTPQLLTEFSQSAAEKGIQVIIAGAGGAAHLPGMIAAQTHIPVLGVPVQSRVLNGVDSLLSIVQMPAGIPVPTMAIGRAGATNAGLSAVSILALNDKELSQRYQEFRTQQTERVLGDSDPRIEVI